ncbi:hypothetical protein YERSI8AC_100057 [Enterobacterales bacterium 8AC]|nr:hypothetical protein YERSI8AC_100057 [Enterobacterales bacterium 8AC]
MLGGTAFGEKVLAQMPVRGMNQAHDTPCVKYNCVNDKGRLCPVVTQSL